MTAPIHPVSLAVYLQREPGHPEKLVFAPSMGTGADDLSNPSSVAIEVEFRLLQRAIEAVILQVEEILALARGGQPRGERGVERAAEALSQLVFGDKGFVHIIG